MEKKNQKNEEFYLTSAPIKKLLLKFSIPCVLSMLVGALYNIVDQIFLGNSTAGQSGIMATTLVYPFTVIALAIAFLLGDGCAAIYSISLGKKDKELSKKSVGNAITISVVASIIFMVVGYILMKPILGLLGANGYDPITKKFTEEYFLIVLAGMPFYMFTNTAASIIRADGAPKYSMIATVIGAIINIILDPILIFGFNLEVKGAAIATIAGQIVSAIVCLLYFRKMKMVKLSKPAFKPSSKIIAKVCKLGISSFITQVAIAVITIVANNVVGAVATSVIESRDAGAALGIVFKVFAIIISFAVGVAVAGQPIIGYNYGAKRYDRVVKTIKTVLLVNVVIGIVATIMFEFAPNIIVMLFGKGSEFYKEYAVLSFRIYLGGILFCCLQKAGCIILQSINKPYKSMVLSLMRDVVLLVPGVCILAFCGNLKTMLWAGIIADIGAFIPTIIFVAIESRKMLKIETNKPEKQKESVQNIAGNKFVITIDREFGSGGKYIAQELAKRFGIKCYDNEILKALAKETDIDISKLSELDETEKSSFWYGFANNYVFENDSNNAISAEDSLFLTQAKIIEDLYKKASCVIVGRGSDQILKNKPNVFSFFIYSSDKDFKIERKMNFEKTSREETIKNIERIDKSRANYYKKFTGSIWGSRENYDMSLDTSRIGVEETISLIEQYIKNVTK